MRRDAMKVKLWKIAFIVVVVGLILTFVLCSRRPVVTNTDYLMEASSAIFDKETRSYIITRRYHEDEVGVEASIVQDYNDGIPDAFEIIHLRSEGGGPDEASLNTVVLMVAVKRNATPCPASAGDQCWIDVEYEGHVDGHVTWDADTNTRSDTITRALEDDANAKRMIGPNGEGATREIPQQTLSIVHNYGTRRGNAARIWWVDVVEPLVGMVNEGPGGGLWRPLLGGSGSDSYPVGWWLLRAADPRVNRDGTITATFTFVHEVSPDSAAAMHQYGWHAQKKTTYEPVAGQARTRTEDTGPEVLSKVQGIAGTDTAKKFLDLEL